MVSSFSNNQVGFLHLRTQTSTIGPKRNSLSSLTREVSKCEERQLSLDPNRETSSSDYKDVVPHSTPAPKVQTHMSIWHTHQVTPPLFPKHENSAQSLTSASIKGTLALTLGYGGASLVPEHYFDRALMGGSL